MYSDIPNAKRNHFARKFLPYRLEIIAASSMKTQNLSFVGSFNEHLYFCDTTVDKLTVTDTRLQNLNVVKFEIERNASIKHPFRASIDGSHAYLFFLRSPIIAVVDLKNPRTAAKHFLNTKFNQAVSIGNNYFAMRTYFSNESGGDYNLSIVNLETQSAFSSDNILEQKLQGGFYNDGIMEYDPSSGKIVYVTYYRNSIFCIDNDLKKHVKFTAIDRCSTSNFKVIGQRDERDSTSWSFTLASPAIVVNKTISVFDGMLHINSALKADNETAKDFNRHAVIDKYDINSKSYVGSFYIPNWRGDQMMSFSVLNNNTILVIYKDGVVIYSLNQRGTKTSLSYKTSISTSRSSSVRLNPYFAKPAFSLARSLTSPVISKSNFAV